ncbi:MAG: Wzz/FepE/Etk N-terminal domain-containing protein [Clostridiales bacterium]|nr:Wzz/FepE/Etk N-terminal domain-containing protein [Clostridiales bacterium]
MNSDDKSTTPLSIDIQSILADILRNWWAISLCALAGLCFALTFLTFFPQYTYTSSAVFVITSGIDSDTLNTSTVRDANTVAETVTNILNSETIKNLVAKESEGLQYTAEAEYIEDANIITFSVTSNSARDAFKAIKLILANNDIVLGDIMSDVRLMSLESPSVANGYNEKNLIITCSVEAFLLFGIGCTAIIVLFSIMRNTIKNQTDARHKIDAQILGTIPWIEHKKKDEQDVYDVPVLGIGKNNRWLKESYRITVTKILGHMQRRHQKRVFITSVLPNEGKSVATLNLAATAASLGYKTLIIDGDFRNPTLGKILNVPDSFKEEFKKTIETGKLNIDKLYKSEKLPLYGLLYQGKSIGSSNVLNNGNFEKILHEAAKQFDFVFIDCGPVALVSDIEKFCSLCDCSVLLAAQDVSSVYAINDAIDELDKERKLIGCIYKETRKNEKKTGTGYYSEEYYGAKVDR